MESEERYIAFEGMSRLVEGTLAEVSKVVSDRLKACPNAPILIFEEATGAQVDFDLRLGSHRSKTVAPKAPAGPGRPKLGVIGREVTLLPRHWEWLNSQPGGASVALRKLVEAARKENVERDETRRRHESAYRFMSAIAGNLPGYEEALRSLFANDRAGVARRIQHWPSDVRDLTMKLAFPSVTE